MDIMDNKISVYTLYVQITTFRSILAKRNMSYFLEYHEAI